MISTPKSFPHYRVNVKDNSIADVAYNEVLPVHRPCYVMRAQKGEINKLVWCGSGPIAERIFGKETFKQTSKYFSLQSLFLKNTLTSNGAFIMRVADEATAEKAFVILEAHVVEEEVPQYVTDENGIRIKQRNLDETSPNYGALEYVPLTKEVTTTVIGPTHDAYGQPIVDAYDNPILGPVPQTTSVPVTEKGVRIKWRVRTQLNEGETGLDDLQVDSVQVGDVITTIYPIMAFEALSEGEYGNNLVFSLFYDKGQNSESLLDDYKSVFYGFEAGEREYNTSTPTPIRSNYGSILSFAANADAVHADTGFSYNMEGVLTRAFDGANKQLPYTIYTYEENMCLVGNRVVEYELNGENETGGKLGFINADNYQEFEGVTFANGSFSVASTATVGYMANIVSGINISGITYDHVIIDTDDTDANYALLQNKAYVYLKNGNDGDISDEAINECLIKFFRGNLPADGSIVDKFRFPITHLYDTGFPLAVKLEMIEFLELRDDVMVELSTQELEVNQLSWNTATAMTERAADEEMGQFLRTRALLQRESVVMGTDCCRCAIYPQAGILADSIYIGIVPFTFWSAMKHAQYGNGTSMSPQEPRGFPYSLNEYFKTYNWLNFDETGQSRVWDLGLNYCQAADMTRIFYPALRTVYRADSSVLTDQWFTEAATVYTKHVIRQAWANHVGRNDPSEVINDALRTYLVNELTSLYNGKYLFEVAVTQSEEERKLGYIRHALIRITSPATFRVLEVDVEVNREDFNEATTGEEQ